MKLQNNIPIYIIYKPICMLIVILVANNMKMLTDSTYPVCTMYTIIVLTVDNNNSAYVNMKMYICPLHLTGLLLVSFH